MTVKGEKEEDREEQRGGGQLDSKASMIWVLKYAVMIGDYLYLLGCTLIILYTVRSVLIVSLVNN